MQIIFKTKAVKSLPYRRTRIFKKRIGFSRDTS